MLIIFDIVGTLFSLDRVKSKFTQKGVPEEIMELWFEKLVQSMMASTLANKYLPFKTLARSTLSHILALKNIDGRHIDDVLLSLQDIEPWDDTADCLGTLRADGHRLVALTNSGQYDAEQLLGRWAIRSEFERIFSADTVKACKPDSALYEIVFRSMFMGPYDCCLVSVHGWDILGAESVGMNSIYVDRIEKQWPFPGGAPGSVVRNLRSVPAAIRRHYLKTWTKRAA